MLLADWYKISESAILFGHSGNLVCDAAPLLSLHICVDVETELVFRTGTKTRCRLPTATWHRTSNRVTFTFPQRSVRVSRRYQLGSRTTKTLSPRHRWSVLRLKRSQQSASASPPTCRCYSWSTTSARTRPSMLPDPPRRWRQIETTTHRGAPPSIHFVIITCKRRLRLFCQRGAALWHWSASDSTVMRLSFVHVFVRCVCQGSPFYGGTNRDAL